MSRLRITYTIGDEPPKVIWANDEQPDPENSEKVTVATGLEALGWYHEKWDDERDVGMGPEHDWASHGSDAWGLMAIVAEDHMRSGMSGIRRDSSGFKRRRGGMAV